MEKTMYTAVLPDDDAGIHGDDFPVGKRRFEYFRRLPVGRFLSVDGQNHGAVDDKIVGVSGGKTFSVIADGRGHGQTQQTIGFSFGRAQGRQLLTEGL